MRLPPRWFRRIIVDPLVFVGFALAVLSMPLWLVGAAFASRFVPGHWRPLRLLWFGFVYVVWEVLMLAAMFGLWIASGFGWKMQSPGFQAMHYRLMGWFLRHVVGSAKRTFRLRVVNDEPEGIFPDDQPALVFCRHAGPGDSLLIVDAAINRGGARPRIVLKDAMQWDPAIDVALNRLPNRFIRSGSEAVAAIEDLAEDVQAGDALVLFPEGGNYTPGRRERAIEKLDEIGRPDLAARARQLENVLLPRATGALAAMAAAPQAGVVVVGHVGLEHMSTVRDLWREMPMDKTVVTKVWSIPRQELPPPDEREAGLYDHWIELDEWITAVKSLPPDR